MVDNDISRKTRHLIKRVSREKISWKQIKIKRKIPFGQEIYLFRSLKDKYYILTCRCLDEKNDIGFDFIILKRRIKVQA